MIRKLKVGHTKLLKITRLSFSEICQYSDKQDQIYQWNKDLTELLSISGIYGICKRHASRIYIGKSFDINVRIRKHLIDLFNGNHHNIKLQDDWNCGMDHLEEMDLLILDRMEYPTSEIESEYIEFFVNIGYALYN